MAFRTASGAYCDSDAVCETPPRPPAMGSTRIFNYANLDSSPSPPATPAPAHQAPAPSRLSPDHLTGPPVPQAVGRQQGSSRSAASVVASEQVDEINFAALLRKEMVQLDLGGEVGEPLDDFASFAPVEMLLARAEVASSAVLFCHERMALISTTNYLEKRAEVLSVTVSEKTMGYYAFIVLRFLEFCEKVRVPLLQRFPIPRQNALLFCSSLAGSLAADTICTYYNGLQTWHLLDDLQLDIPEAAWKFTMKGIKKQAPPPKAQRPPRHLPRPPGHLQAPRPRAPGDVTIPTLAAFNPEWHTTSTDIDFIPATDDFPFRDGRVQVPVSDFLPTDLDPSGDAGGKEVDAGLSEDDRKGAVRMKVW
ncbi:hypothetical protein JCM1840_002749 [Sporobolomyces johnsonii]